MYSANLDFDPNGNIWHLISNVCNKDNADSGTILYELRLYTQAGYQGQYYKIGGIKKQALPPNKCWNRDYGIKVRANAVPPGEYYIVLWVGDWNGSAFDGRPIFQFGNTFVKN